MGAVVVCNRKIVIKKKSQFEVLFFFLNPEMED